eukprot:294657_1
MTAVSDLCAWIKTNRLLTDANDIVLNNSINQIINALGGVKYVLFELTHYYSSAIEQLNTIHNIISTEQRKYNAKNRNQLNISNIDIDNNDNNNDTNSIDSTNNKSLFLYLPNEC